MYHYTKCTGYAVTVHNKSVMSLLLRDDTGSGSVTSDSMAGIDWSQKIPSPRQLCALFAMPDLSMCPSTR